MAIDLLDWPPAVFLVIYGVLATEVALAIFVLRRRIGTASPGRRHDDLGLLELAYLAGGLKRAGDTVLVTFFTAGAAALDANKRWIAVDASAADLPKAVEPFRDVVNGYTTRSNFHKAITGGLEPVREALARRGLAPRPHELRQLQWMTYSLLGILLAVGLTRILAGLARDRPVGYLVCLVLIVGFAGVLAIRHPPFRTRAGRAAIEHIGRRHARAARAPMEPEMALAFAITGPAVLAGSEFAGFGADRSFAGGGGGGGCGGGGGGGGGCGGGCGG